MSINKCDFAMDNETKNHFFEFNDETKKKLNETMVKVLFEIMYKNNMITKKELEELIININRTTKLKNN